MPRPGCGFGNPGALDDMAKGKDLDPPPDLQDSLPWSLPAPQGHFPLIPTNPKTSIPTPLTPKAASPGPRPEEVDPHPPDPQGLFPPSPRLPQAVIPQRQGRGARVLRGVG